VNRRRPPWAAQALLRQLRGRYSESLEGDLLEEFAAGRTGLWYCRQVLSALYERAYRVIRQQAATALAAALFFAVSLWLIAPATWRIMGWARSLDSLQFLVLLAWLTGVPLVLGGVAGLAARHKRSGAILLGAALVYFTPLTLPFTFAACDLCTRSEEPVASGAIQLLTPIVSALLAGIGAWAVTRFPAAMNPERIT
jgi:hypothetical protein